MKCLYIGALCTEKIFQDILKFSNKRHPSASSQVFERMVVEGLSKQTNIEVLSYMSAPTYPSFKKVVYNAKTEFDYGCTIRYMKFFNLIILKQLSIFINTSTFLLWWFVKNIKADKVVLLNVVYPPVAIPVLLLSRLYRYKTVIIMQDMSAFRYEYTQEKGLRKKLLNIFKIISLYLDSKFDAYILLTHQMKDIIAIEKKPAIVMEGMYNHQSTSETIFSQKCQIPTIMYAGSLREIYGIKKLLSAYQRLETKQKQIWIFGAGDAEAYIRELAKQDSSIQFFGIRPHSDILEFEKQATVLVNPRPSTEEFTKYSFPSKNIEYMASGTPLLSTKLPGIPQEYLPFIFIFQDETVDGMARELDRILSLPEEYLNEFGRDARQFILSKKNYLIQTSRIHQFLKSLIM